MTVSASVYNPRPAVSGLGWVAGFTHSLLRIVTGFLFIHPGGLKLLGWFGGMPPGVELTPLLIAAAVIELVGGTLIMVGLFTRPIAFIAAGEMAFAYFIGHFPQGFWPIVNQGQPAVLYCFIFLFLAGNGPGPFSLDEWLRRRRAVRVTESLRAGREGGASPERSEGWRSSGSQL